MEIGLGEAVLMALATATAIGNLQTDLAALAITDLKEFQPSLKLWMLVFLLLCGRTSSPAPPILFSL